MKALQYKKYLFVLLFLVMFLITIAFVLSTSSYEKATSAETKVHVDESVDGLDNIQTTYVNKKDGKHYVCPCGYPIGIYVKTEGVMVIRTGSFKGLDGSEQAPCKDALEQGDYIVGINGTRINDKQDLMEIVKNNQGSRLDVSINRRGKKMNVKIYPKQNEHGKYMLGLWIKDDISGIGTLTYVDEKGFGALGHSINDNDTGEMFVISEGAIFETQLLRIVKSDGAHAGRLEGFIDYETDYMLGKVSQNSVTGIKGTLTKLGKQKLSFDNWIAVGASEDVHCGYAQILSWISGEPGYYDIEILNVNNAKNDNCFEKNIEIKITDQKLLDMTSGIVQGLSGTPIMQDGKIIGAITHVFVNDPTKGYGIFIENMLEYEHK